MSIARKSTSTSAAVGKGRGAIDLLLHEIGVERRAGLARAEGLRFLHTPAIRRHEEVCGGLLAARSGAPCASGGGGGGNRLICAGVEISWLHLKREKLKAAPE